MNDYIVWDNTDAFRAMLKDPAGLVHGKSPEHAAQQFACLWADTFTALLDDQEQYLIYVLPLEEAQQIFTNTADIHLEDVAKVMAKCYRGYISWNVELVEAE